jgi:hypothetical protein
MNKLHFDSSQLNPNRGPRSLVLDSLPTSIFSGWHALGCIGHFALSSLFSQSSPTPISSQTLSSFFSLQQLGYMFFTLPACNRSSPWETRKKPLGTDLHES